MLWLLRIESVDTAMRGSIEEGMWAERGEKNDFYGRMPSQGTSGCWKLWCAGHLLFNCATKNTCEEQRARLRKHTRQEQHKRGESPGRFEGRWIKGILVAALFAALLRALITDITAKSYIQVQICSGGLSRFP